MIIAYTSPVNTIYILGGIVNTIYIPVALCRVSSLDNLLVTHILHTALAHAHSAWPPLLSCFSLLPLTILLQQTDLYCGPLLDQLLLPQMTQVAPWPFWLVPYRFLLFCSPNPSALTAFG